MRPRPRITAKCGQVLPQRPQFLTCCRQRAQIDAAPAIQRLTLSACPQQRLVLVLPVKVDEFGSQLR